MTSPEPRSDLSESVRMSLSALADGRAEDADKAIAAWSHDAQARQTWHAYQLIGDVLRSDDLSASADHDEAFLLRLRQQLAKEPVVLAPQILVAPRASAAPVTASKRLGRRWSAAAAFAGVALVGGVVWTLQRQSADAEQLAKSAAPVGGGTVIVSQGAGAWGLPAGQRVGIGTPAGGKPERLAAQEAQEWHMLDERDLRDARLQSYLRAHRGGAAVGARVEPVGLGQ
jgi:sigma-E factor negative regulatory protein RseA